MGLKLKYKALSDVGRVRKANEDCFGELLSTESNGNGSLFIVCDGMGGHVGGAVASQTAVNSIKDFFKNEYYPDPIKAIEKSILFANQKVYQLSQERFDLKGMGTTCVVLLQRDNDIYIAHVGDSRIYLQSDKQIHRLTKDHSYVQSLVDMGEIVAMDGLSIDEQMESHPRSNEVSRAIGIRKDVNVEVCPTPIYPKSGDTFLLCTDGLTGLVNDPTISNTLNNSIDNNKIAKELISMANNAGGKDNITVSLISITDSPHRNSQFIDKSNQSNIISGTQEHFLESNPSNASNFFNKASYFFNKRKKIFLGLFFVVCCAIASLIIFKKPPEIIVESIPGCTDENAINYNSEATDNDNSCEYSDDDTGSATTVTSDRDKVEESEADQAAKEAWREKVNGQLTDIDEWQQENPNWEKDYEKIQKKLNKKEYNKYLKEWRTECKNCKDCSERKKKRKCKKFTSKNGNKQLIYQSAGILFVITDNDIESIVADVLDVNQESQKDTQENQVKDEIQEFINTKKNEGFTPCLFKENKELFKALKDWNGDPELNLTTNKDRSANIYGDYKVIFYNCNDDSACEEWINSKK